MNPRLLLVALQLMTRLPVGDPRRDEGDSGASVAWFGVVGAIVGGVAASAFWLSGLVLPATGAAVIAVTVTILITGGLHEDGLADAADGLFGGATPDRRLEIMRDPSVGSYGILALILSVLFRVLLLASLSPAAGAGALVAVSAASRGALGVTLIDAVPAADDGSGAGLLAHLRPVQAVVGLGVAVAVCAVAVRVVVIPVVVMSLLATTGVRGLSTRRLGGVSDDIMGTMIATAEVAGLLAAAIAATYELL